VLVDLRKALLSQVWDDVKAVLMKAASMPYNSEEISLANEEVRPHQSESERGVKLNFSFGSRTGGNQGRVDRDHR
jgi:hypothetical protein